MCKEVTNSIRRGSGQCEHSSESTRRRKVTQVRKPIDMNKGN